MRASLGDVILILERMQANPAEAVQLSQLLPELIGNLTPPAAELLSRPHFECASLWSHTAQFEFVAPRGDAPTQNIRLQEDTWIRGVQCSVLPGLDRGVTTLANWLSLFAYLQGIANVTGENGRGLVELAWRIDARQGFISTGTNETFSIASLVTGDGTWMAPLDWQLQKDQVIEVRLRSRILDYLPVSQDFPETALALRWVNVTFWGEGLRQPSVQGENPELAADLMGPTAQRLQRIT